MYVKKYCSKDGRNGLRDRNQRRNQDMENNAALGKTIRREDCEKPKTDRNAKREVGAPMASKKKDNKKEEQKRA